MKLIIMVPALPRQERRNKRGEGGKRNAKRAHTYIKGDDTFKVTTLKRGAQASTRLLLNNQ